MRSLHQDREVACPESSKPTVQNVGPPFSPVKLHVCSIPITPVQCSHNQGSVTKVGQRDAGKLGREIGYPGLPRTSGHWRVLLSASKCNLPIHPPFSPQAHRTAGTKRYFCCNCLGFNSSQLSPVSTTTRPMPQRCEVDAVSPEASAHICCPSQLNLPHHPPMSDDTARSPRLDMRHPFSRVRNCAQHLLCSDLAIPRPKRPTRRQDTASSSHPATTESPNFSLRSSCSRHTAQRAK